MYDRIFGVVNSDETNRYLIGNRTCHVSLSRPNEGRDAVHQRPDIFSAFWLGKMVVPSRVLYSFLAVTFEVTNGQVDSYLFELQVGVSALSDQRRTHESQCVLARKTRICAHGQPVRVPELRLQRYLPSY
jgi:hypothetical protein